ncbi:hypothetical protein E2P81_ATG07686 [Venturia nashicola]|uniref:Uncharacterized protein n=1 Tax=Venturia nashicola TaxID=86259 RepID=A0A4Z1P5F0_9PEZI|nr:hypothetical protein E6O75_ATG07850 [Venturia nashicola]TLD22493.1 hypothetical protein E2P81_ATG07686 [Venturia nashicola]
MLSLSLSNISNTSQDYIGLYHQELIKPSPTRLHHYPAISKYIQTLHVGVVQSPDRIRDHAWLVVLPFRLLWTSAPDSFANARSLRRLDLYHGASDVFGSLLNVQPMTRQSGQHPGRALAYGGMFQIQLLLSRGLVFANERRTLLAFDTLLHEPVFGFVSAASSMDPGLPALAPVQHFTFEGTSPSCLYPGMQDWWEVNDGNIGKYEVFMPHLSPLSRYSCIASASVLSNPKVGVAMPIDLKFDSCSTCSLREGFASRLRPPWRLFDVCMLQLVSPIKMMFMSCHRFFVMGFKAATPALEPCCFTCMEGCADEYLSCCPLK